MLKCTEAIKRAVLTPATCIGIAGGTCSGKSTLALALRRRLGENNCAILQIDNFYRPQKEGDILKGTANLDCPGAFKMDEFVAAFLSLRKGQDIRVPFYDRASIQLKEPVLIEARSVLVVEGLFVLADQRVTDCLTLSVFVEIESDVQWARRLTRDITENGMTLESSLMLFTRDAVPGFEKHVLPTRMLADLILSGSEDCNVMADKVVLALEKVGVTLPAKL